VVLADSAFDGGNVVGGDAECLELGEAGVFSGAHLAPKEPARDLERPARRVFPRRRKREL